ncbi:MAG: hypothetical protein JWQ69_3390 [Pseudomonas sp.]|nr:hypothetical protein [Pseudomonas sp.]
MQGPTRKVLQAVLYETGGVLFLAPALSLMYDEGLVYSGALSVLMSTSALLWNMIFNYGFEYWEARQAQRSRTFGRRLMLSLGYEGSLTLMLVPLIAWWLHLSWMAALATNLGLFVFFFFYAFVFQWAFDRLFDVPLSAQKAEQCSV